MTETTKFTPQAIKMILENAHSHTEHESQFDPTLLAISTILEQGVRPNTIINVFGSMGLGYGRAFVLEGSKYKYKQIRNKHPHEEKWHQGNIQNSMNAALN